MHRAIAACTTMEGKHKMKEKEQVAFELALELSCDAIEALKKIRNLVVTEAMPPDMALAALEDIAEWLNDSGWVIQNHKVGLPPKQQIYYSSW